MRSVEYFVPAAIRRHVRLWRHRGTAVTCPICGYQARDLKVSGQDFPVLRERQVIGAGTRPVKCHRCGSADRARLVYLYLRDHVGLDRAASMRVLHVAPEPGLTEKLLELGFAEYVCGDLFTEGYTYPAWVRNLDATDIQFDDDTFDLLMCNHVLEHIPDDRRAMRELCRVLKPGGVAILQVPISANSATTLEDPQVTDPHDRARVFGQFNHVRIYGQDYTARLEQAGFVVREVDVAAQYAQHGVNPEEALFVCTK
jgi:SAM-dependent methyltransferase